MGLVQFGVPRELVLWAKETFGIRAFVETGTNRAGTTIWAREHFAKVVTVEGERALYDEARRRYGDRGITFVHGDSRALLEPLLAELDEPAILWLDAHWCGEGTFGPQAECPLLEELAAVGRSRHEHVVLIDDARLFLAPPPAPHKASEWPDLLQVAQALASEKSPRYAVVYEDILAAVPASAREALVAFVRQRSAEAPSGPAARAVGIARKIARRLRA